MFETNELLYIGILIGGLVLGIVISIFSNARNLLRLGHLIGISVYMVLVFVFITHYAKLKTSRPQKYKKNLKIPFGDENCKQLDCVEPLKNTYEMLYLDDGADFSVKDTSQTAETIIKKCSVYYDWKSETGLISDKSTYAETCYVVPHDNKQRSEKYRPTKSGQLKARDLFLYDFFIKSSFNSCASGDLQNDYVNIESLNLAIRLGCRFLDFEVYTIDGVPSVATSTNRDSFHFKESLNHIPLEEVLKTVKENAMSASGCKNHTDPLLLHFRIKTVQRTTYRKMASLLNGLFGTAIITESDSDYATGNDRSPFSLPIEYTFGRVFVIFNNYAGGDIFPVNFRLSDHMMTGDRGDLREMSTAITTWSGDNHTRTGMYAKREYLMVLYNDETNDKHYRVMLEKSVTIPDEPYAVLDLTYMYMMWPSGGSSFDASYKSINEKVLRNGNFILNQHLPTTARIEKGKTVQIVPICIQEFQVEPKSKEKDDKEKGDYIVIEQWWRFFYSVLYDRYSPLSEDDVRAVGLRQRIPKYKIVTVLSDITMPKNLKNKPIKLWDKITSEEDGN